MCKQLTQDIVQLIQVRNQGYQCRCLGVAVLQCGFSAAHCPQRARLPFGAVHAACGALEHVPARAASAASDSGRSARVRPASSTTRLQERNVNHPDGGPEASRMTAAARRKLGTLGTSLDSLYSWLDSDDANTL